MMEVLGVDQSFTKTGVARAGVAKHILLGLITTEASPTPSVHATRSRIRYIVGGTLKFAPLACLSVLEQPIVARGGKGGAQLERAWLFGLLVDQLVLRGPVATVHPSTRAMYAADNGSASKTEVLAAMRAKFPELIIRDDNEADALALLCMGARYLGQPLDGVASKKQDQAMAAVAWPSNPKESKS